MFEILKELFSLLNLISIEVEILEGINYGYLIFNLSGITCYKVRVMVI